MSEAEIHFMEIKNPTDEDVHYALGVAATHEMVIDVLLDLVDLERQKRTIALARVGMGRPLYPPEKSNVSNKEDPWG